MVTEARHRLDHVQGLRGLAMAVIVAYHCDLPPAGGFLAIDVFFVISGYVIAGLVLREHRERGRIDLGEFYLRRVRRLLPALALVLIVVAALSALLESSLAGQRTTGRIGAYASVSLSNYALYTTGAGYFAPDAESLLLRHTWSLAVEEQYYLLFPVMVAVALAARRRLHNLVLVVAVVAAASFAVLVLLSQGRSLGVLGRPESAAYYLPVARVWEMGLGVLLAVWHLSRPALTDRRAGALALGSGAVLLACLVGFDADGQASSPALLLPVAATALLLAACRSPGAVTRALSWGPMCWIGDRSYGWYLWHWPLIVLAARFWADSTLALLLAAGLALLVSTVTYRLVEQRFRYPSPGAGRARRVRTGLALAAVCVAAGLVVNLALVAAARQHWGSEQVQDMAAQVLPRPVEVSAELLSTCWPSAGSCPGATTSAVYLVGDSNAGHFASGLGLAAQEQQRPFLPLWRAGCSFTGLSVERPDQGPRRDPASCDRHNRRALALLAQVPAGTVVVANSGDAVLAPEVVVTAPAVSRAPVDKARAYEAGLRRVLSALRGSGHRVVLLLTLPHPGGVTDTGRPRWDPQDCPHVRAVLSDDGCVLTEPLLEEDERQAAALRAERAAASATGAVAVDLRGDVCPAGQCSTRRAGLWVYRDGNHLSESASRRLAPVLGDVLRTGG